MNKKYVKVLVEINELGDKSPKTIYYDDQKFQIDRVIDMKKCPSMKVGGIGERYTIRIGESVTYLFFENNKWFVEEK